MLSLAVAVGWLTRGAPAYKLIVAIVTYFVGIAIAAFVGIFVDLYQLVVGAQQTAPPERRLPYWPTKLEFVAVAVSLLLAIGFNVYDSIFNTPDVHPLQRDRIYLHLVGVFFIVVNFIIDGIIARRVGRPMMRLRRGLCPTCGYDLRATTERCPECGAPAPIQAATGTE
jgi:hypothetical protein